MRKARSKKTRSYKKRKSKLKGGRPPSPGAPVRRGSSGAAPRGAPRRRRSSGEAAPGGAAPTPQAPPVVRVESFQSDASRGSASSRGSAGSIGRGTLAVPFNPTEHTPLVQRIEVVIEIFHTNKITDSTKLKLFQNMKSQNIPYKFKFAELNEFKMYDTKIGELEIILEQMSLKISNEGEDENEIVPKYVIKFEIRWELTALNRFQILPTLIRLIERIIAEREINMSIPEYIYLLPTPDLTAIGPDSNLISFKVGALAIFTDNKSDHGLQAFKYLEAKLNEQNQIFSIFQNMNTDVKTRTIKVRLAN